MTLKERLQKLRILPLLKVSLYISSLSLASWCFIYFKAKSKVQTEALHFGRELHKVSEVNDGDHAIKLNNQLLFLSSHVENRTSKSILDEAEKQCSEDTNIVAKAFQKKNEKSNVLRKENADEGMVLCFAKQPGAPKKDWKDEAMAFALSTDLGELGVLHYMYVKKLKTGTRVLSMKVDDHFKLSSFTEKSDGDSEGTDPRIVPRPEHSARKFTAELVGTEHGIWMYDVKNDSESIMKDYDKYFDAKGYVGLEAKREVGHARGYTKGGVQVILVAEPNEEKPGYSTLSIGEMNSGTEFSKKVD